MAFSEVMNVMPLVAVVAIAPVVLVIAWTVRDHRSAEARWQTTTWGLAAVSFLLLTSGLWALALLRTGLIAVLGSGVMAFALATVGLLRLRRPRAALLCLFAHVSISIQLVATLNLADDANYWNWTIWPAAFGAVMLLASRDRARVLSG